MTAAPELPVATLDALILAGDLAFDEFRTLMSGRHHLFIPCDARGAYETLRDLRANAATFVELGSGAGIVTVMADLLGFEAYGIELEPWLVQRSTDIALDFDSGAVFAEGSFVPADYREEIELLASDRITLTDGACGFEELGLELSDFDCVFAYPWPGEEEWLLELVRRYGRADALLVTYDVAEGFRRLGEA